MDVSARKPVIKAAALAYCQEKGAKSADAGSPALCLHVAHLFEVRP